MRMGMGVRMRMRMKIESDARMQEYQSTVQYSTRDGFDARLVPCALCFVTLVNSLKVA